MQEYTISHIASHPFGSQFHKSDLLQLPLEHLTKFEKPKIVIRYLPIHLQHICIHHNHIPNCYLTFCTKLPQMFLSILWQLTNKHDRHAPWIVLKGHLTLVVVYVSVLVHFVEF